MKERIFIETNKNGKDRGEIKDKRRVIEEEIGGEIHTKAGGFEVKWRRSVARG